MRRQFLIGGALCAFATLFGAVPSASFAVLYSQNFDANDTANWTVNDSGFGTNTANFFFNYSTVGIPPAPNSTGGTTRGLKLSANLVPSPIAGPNPGLSVSPLGKSFTGDYEVKFDWWSNYLGPLGASPASATQVSTFGILTSGNVANYVGASDGLFFAATGNGGVADSAAINIGDFTAYSVERPIGYQSPIDDPADAHAFYFAGGRDNTAAGYATAFPAGAAAPAVQQANFPMSQTGTTPVGATGFRWHQVEIEKLGNAVAWRVDGQLLVFVDATQFQSSLGGSNIMFGHSDIDLISTTNPNFATLQFTLIDNVRVLSLEGDYNRNGNVEAADYVVWKNAYGTIGTHAADGNGDGVVNAADYTVWRNSLSPGGGAGGVGEVTFPVPEPATPAGIGSLVFFMATAARRIR